MLQKLSKLEPAEQGLASNTFILIGGILGVEDEIATRIQSDMIDVMNNKVLGPAIRHGLEQGLAQGRTEGRNEGRNEGMAKILLSQLQRRFGSLPSWAKTRIADASPENLEAWSLRLLDAPTLEAVFD